MPIPCEAMYFRGEGDHWRHSQSQGANNAEHRSISPCAEGNAGACLQGVSRCRDAMAKWLPPHGFTGKVHHMDARVGGIYKMSFTNFTTGKSHSFGGMYLELVPNERLR